MEVVILITQNNDYLQFYKYYYIELAIHKIP